MAEKERLVYCNILEHLILHIKIAILRQKEFLSEPKNVTKFFTTGGIFMICLDINDMFLKNGTTIPWKKDALRKLKKIIQSTLI